MIREETLWVAAGHQTDFAERCTQLAWLHPIERKR